MKKSGVILILLLVFSVPTQAWERTYGGSGWDEGRSVCETSDGGYIITGYTNSFGGGADDVYLIKTDTSGDTIWTRTYGGSHDDRGYSVCETSDEGYIIAGWTNSFGAGFWDVYLIKTDASGDSIWTRTYGGNDDDEGRSVRETSDGGYIITGETRSFGAGFWDFYLIKTDASGDTIWTRTYGGSDADRGYSGQQTSDGGYIIAGETESFDGITNPDVYLIKTDASGDTIWTRTYGGSKSDRGYSVCETSDEGYIITGSTLSFGAGYADIYLIKTDASGDTIWTRAYGGSKQDKGRSVCETSDGGYIVTGDSCSFGGGPSDVYLIKTDADGNSGGIGENKETKYAPRLLLEVQSPCEGELDFSFFLPSSGLARVKLYDAAGKRVGVIEDGERQAGWHHISHTFSMPCGIYFVQLSTTLKEGYKLSRSNITEKVILLGN